MAPKQLVRGDRILIEGTVVGDPELGSEIWCELGEGTHLRSTYVPIAAIHSITKPVFKAGDPVRLTRNGVAGVIVAADEVSGQAWCRFGGPSAKPESVAFTDLERRPKGAGEG